MKYITVRNKMWIAAALVFLGVSANGTWTIYDAYNKKISMQTRNNAELGSFRRRLTELMPVKEDWVQTYPSLRGSKNMLSLYRLLRVEEAGLKSNPDFLSASELVQVVHGGTTMDLFTVCLKTGNGFMVEAPTLSSILNGMDKFMSAPHLQADSVTVETGQHGAVGRIENLCMRMRDAL